MEADAKAALEVDRTGGVQRHGSPLTSLWPGLVQLWNNPDAHTCLHLRDPKRKERGALEKVGRAGRLGIRMRSTRARYQRLEERWTRFVYLVRVSQSEMSVNKRHDAEAEGLREPQAP